MNQYTPTAHLKARLILDIIETWEKKYPPSMRELCEASGISSTGVVSFHIDRLVRMGYVEKEPKVARGISRTDKQIDNRDFQERRNGTNHTGIRQGNKGAKAGADHPDRKP